VLVLPHSGAVAATRAGDGYVPWVEVLVSAIGWDNPWVGDSKIPWRNTTHDWAKSVDAGHLAEIRRNPARFAPGGILHLALEVIAYAADEAENTPAGRCVVTLHNDGSLSVADNGRGTDTRYDEQGRPIRKPVMATKDLRYFEFPGAQRLPDGHARRGMSIVAALSGWLIHTNRRHDRAWTQRYEHGMPVTDLLPIPGNDTTGTTVRFLPDAALGTSGLISAPELVQLTRTACPRLTVETVDERII
jgi:DNA gyrase subunit B